MVISINYNFIVVTVNKKVWLTKNYWGGFLKRDFKNFSIFFKFKKIKK